MIAAITMNRDVIRQLHVFVVHFLYAPAGMPMWAETTHAFIPKTKLNKAGVVMCTTGML